MPAEIVLPLGEPNFRHDFPFDPTYGYDLKRLLAVPSPEPPADFEAFWRNAYAGARAVDLNLRVSASPLVAPHHTVHDIAYTSVGGQPIGAWALLPKKGAPTAGFVVGHGYGGREGPDFDLPLPDAAAIFPCARGLGISHVPGLATNNSAAHVISGIESRETYIHGLCCADYWLAASALIELCPAIADRLVFYGESFGGGIGALMLPWDDRFRAGALGVPSFGHHPLRVTLPCNGSGAAVTAYWEKHPEVLDVLRYFDAATAARFLTVPSYFHPALFDPAVPPPGQFAVANAAPGARVTCVLTAGHFVYRGEAEEYRRHRELRRAFFTEVLAE